MNSEPKALILQDLSVLPDHKVVFNASPEATKIRYAVLSPDGLVTEGFEPLPPSKVHLQGEPLLDHFKFDVAEAAKSKGATLDPNKPYTVKVKISNDDEMQLSAWEKVVFEPKQIIASDKQQAATPPPVSQQEAQESETKTAPTPAAAPTQVAPPPPVSQVAPPPPVSQQTASTAKETPVRVVATITAPVASAPVAPPPPVTQPAQAAAAPAPTPVVPSPVAPPPPVSQVAPPPPVSGGSGGGQPAAPAGPAPTPAAAPTQVAPPPPVSQVAPPPPVSAQAQPAEGASAPTPAAAAPQAPRPASNGVDLVQIGALISATVKNEMRTATEQLERSIRQEQNSKAHAEESAAIVGREKGSPMLVGGLIATCVCLTVVLILFFIFGSSRRSEDGSTQARYNVPPDVIVDAPQRSAAPQPAPTAPAPQIIVVPQVAYQAPVQQAPAQQVVVQPIILKPESGVCLPDGTYLLKDTLRGMQTVTYAVPSGWSLVAKMVEAGEHEYRVRTEVGLPPIYRESSSMAISSVIAQSCAVQSLVSREIPMEFYFHRVPAPAYQTTPYRAY